MNGLAQVVLDTRAVSRESGRESFDRRGGAFSGRLVRKNDTYQQTLNLMPVDSVAIDRLIAEESLPAPDIVKIDVEGNEGLVLEGMTQLLQSAAPIILCELHTHLGESSATTADLLLSHGYRIFSVDEVLHRGLANAQALTQLDGVDYIVASKGDVRTKHS